MRLLVATIVLIIMVLVILEWMWLRAKANERARTDAKWRETEERIKEELSRPERQGVVPEVWLRAQSQHASLTNVCKATANAVQAPAAVITTIEFEGQRWLAFYGAEWVDDGTRFGESITPLDDSFCKYVVSQDAPLVICDSTNDIRVRTVSPEIRNDIRSYLGAPVHTEDGIPVGSLCVFDTRVRKWTKRDETVVSSFASLVVL